MLDSAAVASTDAFDLAVQYRLPALDLDTFIDKGYLTHSLHPYPAKFVPQIPGKIIEALAQPGDVILDPFCGSGTTIVEAALKGRNSFAVDSNPLASKIAKAKVLVCGASDLEALGRYEVELGQLACEYLARPESPPVEPIIPEFRNRQHWFHDDAAIELGLIRRFIDGCPSDDLSNLLEVVFSSIIVRCSRQESDTRWCAVDKPFVRGDAFTLMLARLRTAVSSAADFARAIPQPFVADVRCEDSRNLSHIPDGSIGLVVTSPPYLNSFDYYLYHKLRMFWLRLDHYEAQERELGSRNKHCDEGHGPEAFYGAMAECVSEVRRVLRTGGKAAVVVGDSIFKGRLLPMDEPYRRLFAAVGMRCADSFSFDQRKYTRSFTPKLKTGHKRTHVLLFEID